MRGVRFPNSHRLCGAVLLLTLGCNASDTTSPSAGLPQVTSQSPQGSAATGSSLSVTGKIAFASSRDGNSEIYVMNVNGTGLTRLTNNPAGDGEPAWSPNGSKIPFVSTRAGNYEIYVMNANGTGVTRLTNNPAIDEAPTWSPDGTKIAFVSTRATYRQIYVMNANGTGVTQLTQGVVADNYPTWSPDGTKIAFEHMSHRIVNRQIVFSFDIAVVPAGGGGVVPITHTGHEHHPAWSPDGTKIVFSSTRDGLFHNNSPARELYMMNANGSAVIRLTNNTVNDDGPTWSPGGTKIAFESDRSGPVELYTMNPNGTAVTKLTSNTSSNTEPAWGP